MCKYLLERNSLTTQTDLNANYVQLGLYLLIPPNFIPQTPYKYQASS